MTRVIRRLWMQGLAMAGILAAGGTAAALYHHHMIVLPPRPAVQEVTPPEEHGPEWIQPQGIVLHSSDSPARYGAARVTASFLEQMHTEDHPRWATEFEGKVYHIGYHYVVLPDGTVQAGRPEHCRGTHCRHYNDWLGICTIGAFASDSPRSYWPRRPTEAQVRALVALCKQLMLKYHIPLDRVKRHRDLGDTLCPGGRFPFDAIQQELRSWAAGHPESPVQPEPAPANPSPAAPGVSVPT